MGTPPSLRATSRSGEAWLVAAKKITPERGWAIRSVSPMVAAKKRTPKKGSLMLIDFR